MRCHPLRIVPMTRTHVPACNRIVSVSDPWKTLREKVNFLPALKQNPSQAYVAAVGQDTAGFIIFTASPVFARGGYIRAVGVAPEMRRLGIGRRLITFAETVISRTAPNVYLCVSSFNRSGRAFYKKMGYTMIGKIPGLIRKGHSEQIFWKRLRMSSKKL